MPIPNMNEDSRQSEERADSMSIRSDAPLRGAGYRPVLPSYQSEPVQGQLRDRHIVMPESSVSEALRQRDAERAQTYPEGTEYRPAKGRNGSWDMLAGIKKFEHSYEAFHSRNASESHLVFADGDVPSNKFARFYNYLIDVSIVARWILFIVPVLIIIWIPGVLGLTKFPDANVWGVRLLWWSIWLSAVWIGWWACLAVSRMLPHVARYTIGAVAFASRRYIDWLEALHRYVALFGWTLLTWLTFNALINARQQTSDSGNITLIDTFAKFFFGIYICAVVLLVEKFAIQFIAGKFHERSYAERIQAQKFAVSVLVTLYRYSRDIPGTGDATRTGPSDKRATLNPKKFFKKALKGVKFAATTTTTALGNVASEIAGSSVLQPNSPQAMVKTALESANKSRALARRIFFSFCKVGSDYMTVEDIGRYFATPDDADAAFAIFDADSNGDASFEEVEIACMEFHREQLSIENSMRDLDSAVGRLDNILMSLYVVVAILIIAVSLEAQLATLITAAGTVIIGLSWLIGSSLAEVLTSIIFLFVKHPYDVGDRVTVEEETYTVKEIRLLSTIFLDGNTCHVQAPNTVLNEKFILNLRRSPQMSESFTFDVAFSTSFEQIEHLREVMLKFLQLQRRDFHPSFDVVVVDIPEQEKMILKADIKYKSNWQQGALRAKRRNQWICALKKAMAKVQIYGPAGSPDESASPKKYTLVPWEEAKREAQEHEREHKISESTSVSPSAWAFTDQIAVMQDDSLDVFGESAELRANPLGSPSSLRQRPPPVSMPSAVSTPYIGHDEEFEMRTPTSGTLPPR